MQDRSDVLDHGFVRLVDHMDNDLSIVRAARVSYDAAWRAGEDDGSDAKLIRYLWKHQHTTPFEAVEFQFEVMAPIFVLRQWHRHRTASINELSARYRELPKTYYLPEPENVGAQSTSSKQARDITGENRAQRAVEIAYVDRHCASAFLEYRKLLASGWPRELARMVLPLNTYSHMFWKVNLRNLFHFLTLRCDAHAQYEIRVYADAMRELVRPIVPVAVSAWESNAVRHPYTGEPVLLLWCCYVRGPDDVHAAPDYDTALKWSDRFNDWWARQEKRENDPIMRAAPALYPWGAAAHAAALTECLAQFADGKLP